jgi:D-arabinose 1-dehydrogenase-like Zn-dependent alcohol dehydrogenase
MRQLQLVAHGEPSDVIELDTVSAPTLGEEDVLVSMEAAPLNPSDFLFVRGMYGVRPAFPSSVGAEGVGRVAKIGSKVDVVRDGSIRMEWPSLAHPTRRKSKTCSIPSSSKSRSNNSTDKPIKISPFQRPHHGLE